MKYTLLITPMTATIHQSEDKKSMTEMCVRFGGFGFACEFNLLDNYGAEILEKIADAAGVKLIEDDSFYGWGFYGHEIYDAIYELDIDDIAIIKDSKLKCDHVLTK